MSENKINRIKEYCKENIKENKKDVTTAFDKVMTSELINNIIKYEIAY